MAAVIETKCPECYELVKPRAADVSLVVETRLRGRYTFPCPECRCVVTKDADAGAIRALRYARVREVEAPTLSRRPDGPPLTEDDLIAFGRELESAIAVPTRN